MEEKIGVETTYIKKDRERALNYLRRELFKKLSEVLNVNYLAEYPSGDVDKEYYTISINECPEQIDYSSNGEMVSKRMYATISRCETEIVHIPSSETCYLSKKASFIQKLNNCFNYLKMR
jgi:hypothetical protein